MWGHLSVFKIVNTSCLMLNFFLLDFLWAFRFSDLTLTLMEYEKYFISSEYSIQKLAGHLQT